MSKRLYVGNLSYSVSEDDLLQAFSAYGATEATIPTDESGRSKGFGFVEVEDGQANAAIEAMNGKEHNGRTLTVNEARPRPDRRSGGGYGGGGYGGGGYDRGGGGYDRGGYDRGGRGGGRRW